MGLWGFFCISLEESGKLQSYVYLLEMFECSNPFNAVSLFKYDVAWFGDVFQIIYDVSNGSG